MAKLQCIDGEKFAALMEDHTVAEVFSLESGKPLIEKKSNESVEGEMCVFWRAMGESDVFWGPISGLASECYAPVKPSPDVEGLRFAYISSAIEIFVEDQSWIPLKTIRHSEVEP